MSGLPANRFATAANPTPDGVAIHAPRFRIRLASSFPDRLLGLFRIGVLQSDEGLLIDPCSAIHTFGMRYPIDAIFLSQHGDVIRVVPDLVPWRFRWCHAAKCVLELQAGSAALLGISKGDRLSLPAPSSVSRPRK